MKPADDVEDADSGLAGERTHLAWTRTAIALAAVGAAIIKSRPAAGVPVLVLSVVIWELSRLHRRSGGGRAGERRLLVIAAAVTAIAAAALVLSFLGPSSGWLVVRHP